MSETNFTIHDTTLLVQMIIHDMDAPLAVIERLMSRICIGRFDPNNETHSRLIRSSNMALDRVRKMLRDMQDVISGRSLQVKFEDIELKSLASSIVQEISPVIASESQRLKTVCRNNKVISTDTNLLKRVAINFLMNAVFHNVKGKSIELTFFGLENDGYGLEVKNFGKIIPEENLKNIFQPGVQLNLTANRKFRGHGLGLAFSKMVAEALGGEIKAENIEDETGVCFSLVVNK
jgi:two-component system phosphate regulon sensor histidine kinase PhoR